MERGYRILFLIALIGIAAGIAAMMLDYRVIAAAGCLIVPVVAYLIAVLIGIVNDRD